jgi:hypothetical protein
MFDYDNDSLLDLFMILGQGPHLCNLGTAWRESDRALSPEVRAGGESTPSPPAIWISMATPMSWRACGTAAFGVAQRRRVRSAGNRNPSLRVRLTARVSNRSSVGAGVEMRSGSLWDRDDGHDAGDGPRRSRMFGLGRRTAADVVRVLWPSGILQAETPAISRHPRRSPSSSWTGNRRALICYVERPRFSS